MMKTTLRLAGIFFLFLLVFSCSKDDVAPESIILTASSTTLKADGNDSVTFEVEVYDGDQNQIQGADYEIFVNGKKLSAYSFETQQSGDYEVVAKIHDLESNSVTLKALGPNDRATSIKLTASAERLLANGTDKIIFDVQVLDMEQEIIKNAVYDLFVNDEKLSSSTFTTTLSGNYEAVAKIEGLESNRISLKAEPTDGLVASISVETSTQLLIADGDSSAEIIVKVYDWDNQELTGQDYDLFINGQAYHQTEFKTTQSGKYEITARVGEVWSEVLTIEAREQVSLEEITIPVIFHIVHFGEEIGVGSNINSVYIEEMLDKLNTGFSNGYGTTNPNAVDSYIRFRLATLDPDDNLLQEVGINRINGTSYDVGSDPSKSRDRIMPIPDHNRNSGMLAGSAVATVYNGDIPNDQRFGFDESYALGKEKSWDRNDYFNVYILPVQDDGLAGYAYLPFVWQSNSLEGFTVYPKSMNITIPKNEVCVIDTEAAQWEYSTTIVHEAGHALGLPHTFSDDSCSTSDYCEDTYSYNYDNPYEDCPDNKGLKVNDNFMDYVGARNTFTYDQRERMRHVLEYGYFFSELKNSTK